MIVVDFDGRKGNIPFGGGSGKLDGMQPLLS
jgi:hypothetical protein